MTTPQSILVGATVIGISIVVAQLATPYRITNSSASAFAWRVNQITGDVRECRQTGCE
jgi:hypothetical protein